MDKYETHLRRAKDTGETSHAGDYSYHDRKIPEVREAEEAPRIKIDAVIASPQIIIPRSAVSDEVIVLRILITHHRFTFL